MRHILEKKARYLARYRGTKEADALIGGFVEHYLKPPTLTHTDLEILCQWLNQDDIKILSPQTIDSVFEQLSQSLKKWRESRL